MSVVESLREDLRGLDRSPRRLRSFAFTVGVFLILVALAVGWRRDWDFGGAVRWLAGSGAGLALVGLVAPAVLRPLYLAWMGLALVLGHVMTRVILTVVFFLVVTPIGWLMRAFGKDPLARSSQPELPSYWIEREDGAASRARLERYW